MELQLFYNFCQMLNEYPYERGIGIEDKYCTHMRENNIYYSESKESASLNLKNLREVPRFVCESSCRLTIFRYEISQRTQPRARTLTLVLDLPF